MKKNSEIYSCLEQFVPEENEFKASVSDELFTPATKDLHPSVKQDEHESVKKRWVKTAQQRIIKLLCKKVTESNTNGGKIGGIYGRTVMNECQKALFAMGFFDKPNSIYYYLSKTEVYLIDFVNWNQKQKRINVRKKGKEFIASIATTNEQDLYKLAEAFCALFLQLAFCKENRHSLPLKAIVDRAKANEQVYMALKYYKAYPPHHKKLGEIVKEMCV